MNNFDKIYQHEVINKGERIVGTDPKEHARIIYDFMLDIDNGEADEIEDLEFDLDIAKDTIFDLESDLEYIRDEITEIMHDNDLEPSTIFKKLKELATRC